MKHVYLFIIVFITFNGAQALRFDRACEAGETITIGAVGDVLLHGALQKQSYKNSMGFISLWENIAAHMQHPEIMYANLEGPAAYGVKKGGKDTNDPGKVFDNNVYSGYPLFNYHPSVITDLQASGVDIVSTANNHSMDRGDLGVLRTIESLNHYGLDFTGTRTNTNEEFYTITQQGGWSIAWIACTYGTNGLPDKKDLTLECFENSDRVSQYIKQLHPQVDAVIVTPHWGYEYKLQPNSRQKKYARKWLDEGATAIIGAHPHVPQPWEKHITPDGREGMILYSLGNFVSNQSALNKKTSLLLYLGLTKRNGQTWVNGVRYLPLYMNRYPHTLVSPNFLKNPDSQQKSSLRILAKLLGTERILQPGEAVLTNAECY